MVRGAQRPWRHRRRGHRRGRGGPRGGSRVVFLGAGLSAYITGSTLHPDGGTLASSGWFNWPDEGWASYAPASSLRPSDLRIFMDQATDPVPTQDLDACASER